MLMAWRRGRKINQRGNDVVGEGRRRPLRYSLDEFSGSFIWKENSLAMRGDEFSLFCCFLFNFRCQSSSGALHISDEFGPALIKHRTVFRLATFAQLGPITAAAALMSHAMPQPIQSVARRRLPTGARP